MGPEYLAELLNLPALPGQLAAVERALEAALATDHAELHEPSLRQVTAGGKRLRPVLTLAAASLAGPIPDHLLADVVAGAVAVELVQTGSIVHDDIMDEAQERRGVATVYDLEGPHQAILVGDYLLARAGQAAAGVSKEVAFELATTLAALCLGQSQETVDAYNTGRSIDEMFNSINGKTAALIRSAAKIGVLAGRLPESYLEALGAYGEAFGMAFQIIDDVLDLVSTAEIEGKPVGNDMREGVYTLPVLLALELPEGDRLRPLLKIAREGGEAISEAIKLVRASGTIEQAIKLARDYNRQAVQALETLQPSPVLEGLAGLPDAYLTWTLDSKTDGSYGTTV